MAGSLLHNGLNVAISLPGVEGRYWLEPLAGEIDGAGPRDYALFHDSDRLPIGSCGVNLDFLAAEPADGDFDPLSAGGGVAGIEQTCTWEAQIACDSDYEYYQDNGSSVDNVEAKITNIINVMNEEYERDVQIRHLITTILVRSSVNDPYSNTTNAETLLSEFRNVWNSTQSGIQRDVAHMFTGRNVSGDVIGIAYTTNICTSNAYGLVEDISGLSFQTDLSAHELGHNWSANHCNCPQNTMNAFLGSIAYNQFHPTFTVPEIVAYRNSRSFCLNNVCIPDNDNCDSPVIILGQGSKSFNSTNATTDGPEEPGACDDSGFAQLDKDVWYWLLSDCNQTIRVSTCGSQFDTKLAIYETFCPTGPGELIACNDNACGSASEVTFNGTADAIYRIRVGGVNGASGSGVVTVTCESAPTCPADTNGDAVIDVTDLVNVIVTWGTTSPVGDITGDGNVDVSDLVQIIVNWGPCA